MNKAVKKKVFTNSGIMAFALIFVIVAENILNIFLWYF